VREDPLQHVPCWWDLQLLHTLPRTNTLAWYRSPLPAVLFRAATQAWAQALVNAQKTGVANEAVKAGTRIGSKMPVLVRVSFSNLG
jgi:hypothetical protein